VGFSVLFISILRLARRYIFHSTEPLPPPNRVPLSILSTASAIFWTLLFAVLAVVFARATDEDSLPPTSAWDTYLLIGDVLCGIAIVLSALAVWSALRIWRRPGTSSISKIKFTLVALAGVYLSWFAIHWHLITYIIHRL
jgi:hypothetical protein